jgi:hypothetical protein
MPNYTFESFVVGAASRDAMQELLHQVDRLLFQSMQVC